MSPRWHSWEEFLHEGKSALKSVKPLQIKFREPSSEMRHDNQH